MMTALSKEQIELVLLSGREGWSQTLCVFYHVLRLYRYSVLYITPKVYVVWVPKNMKVWSLMKHTKSLLVQKFHYINSMFLAVTSTHTGLLCHTCIHQPKPDYSILVKIKLAKPK